MKKALLGIFALAGIGAIAAPADAFTVTNLSGTALIYEESNGTTYVGDSAQEALDGLGNVELSGTTSHSGAASFGTSINPGIATTLTGQFADGSAITFSSLTRSDWFGGAYTDAAGTTYTNFAEGWFTQAWNNTSTGLQSYFKKFNPTATLSQAFNLFKLGGNNYGPQRFSDPNVTAISKDASGNVNFSLAGHFEHSTGFKLSEVVKVTYNGETNLFYGFGDAVASGVVSKDDGVSHSGLYNFTIPGEETASVPEPASLLGLVAVGGLMAAKRKFQ